MFTHRARLLWLLLAFSDLILVAVSFEIAYLTRLHMPQMRLFFLSYGVAAGLLGTALVVWAGTGLFLGVYQRLESLNARHM
ncbi:MAG: hypothetical protein O7E51_12525, partial [Acidobacteria bacterium]|nr:hypothetical protein [Acidobacteriota bacterium]